MEDNTVLHFPKPMVQASMQSNTYVIKGKEEKKTLQEMLPKILGQMGAVNPEQIKEFQKILEKEKDKNSDLIPDLKSFEQPNTGVEEIKPTNEKKVETKVEEVIQGVKFEEIKPETKVGEVKQPETKVEEVIQGVKFEELKPETKVGEVKQPETKVEEKKV